MKIALLGPISTSGIAPFLSSPPPPDFPIGVNGAPLLNTLIGALLERGHEVCAITSGGYEAGRDSKPVCLKGARFEFYCCPQREHSIRISHGRPGRILDFFAYERRNMQDVISTVRPDFVHAHWTYEYAMAAMDSGYPYLVTAHDDPKKVLQLYRNAYRLGRYFMARQVLRRAKALAAVSENLKSRLSGLASTEMLVVPNPLSREFISAATARPLPSTFAEYRLISVINGFGYLKNARNSLLAFARLRRQLKGVSYHIYGSDFQADGPGERWAKTQGIAEGVVFHGPVSHTQLVGALRDSTLLLHPSRWEECPMGIAEAMALGLPVVGGRESGGVPWMVDRAGLMVDIDKPDEMADAALRILTDDKLYSACSAAAMERVKAFDPMQVAQQYEAAYMRILSQNKD